MKISLARGPIGPVSTQTAWGCLTSNLALPGSGSLAAGRKSGYGQLLLTGIGAGLTVFFGIRFLMWQFSNWSRFHGGDMDPIEAFGEMWLHLRWAVLGIGIFLIAMLWALASSLGIMAESRKPGTKSPPVL
jgi:hypothetical protein